MADRYTSSAALLSKVLGLEKRAQRPLPAWHASPYDFDKFSLDKIGTGQGAASYGHGIYAAESPAVSGPLGSYDLEFTRKKLREAGYAGDLDQDSHTQDIYEAIRKGMSDHEIATLYGPRYGGGNDQYTDVLMDAQTLRENAAKLYELRLHAAPEDFLDHDATLKDMGPALLEKLHALGVSKREFAPTFKGGMDIYDAFPASDATERMLNMRLRKAAQAHRAEGLRPALDDVEEYLLRTPSSSGGALLTAWPEMRMRYEDAYSGMGMVPNRASGQEVYSKIVRDQPSIDDGEVPSFNTPAASAALKDAGVPGMRYLDGQSRATGDGTRNYVIFDPEIIEIAKKYGLLPAAVGAGAMMGDDDE